MFTILLVGVKRCDSATDECRANEVTGGHRHSARNDTRRARRKRGKAGKQLQPRRLQAQATRPGYTPRLQAQATSRLQAQATWDSGTRAHKHRAGCGKIESGCSHGKIEGGCSHGKLESGCSHGRAERRG